MHARRTRPRAIAIAQSAADLPLVASALLAAFAMAALVSPAAGAIVLVATLVHLGAEG